ncbi:putative zinc finger protein [Orchesella cincta]|uniref:Putative zinc finger protein n=1 Tax=Orchesella cincta TaxID=48709 RepID=A0A1D2M1E0_ORCCI|nr:putative zinc finger protein [Orchesella cincta]
MKVTASKSEEERTESVKSYKCLICLKSFIKRSQLTNHTFMAHTNERPYKCKVCGWTSKTLAYLKQHERLHVGEKNYQCSKCPSKFSCWSDRNKHFNQVHDNLWPCEICKRVFKGKEKLARHELIHSDLKNFVCIFCEHRSRTLPNLMSHIGSVHTREKPFPCAECPAEYSQSSSLKAHVRNAHRKEEWVHKCSVCDKKFPHQAVLNRHLRTHTGERPYICSYSGCDKKFPTQGELSRHNKSHVGEKKYICSICGNGFVTTAMLNQHAKIHDKKFSCNICTKMFPSAFFLKVHQKSHSEHRQFKCEECPSSFFIKGQLNNHVRKIHRKLRPFPCSMCDSRFIVQVKRDKHLSATHLNESVQVRDL